MKKNIVWSLGILLGSIGLIASIQTIDAKVLIYSNEKAQTVDSGEFVIDVQDYENEIELKFGNNIDASVVFDRINNKFVINRAVDIDGDLAVNTDDLFVDTNNGRVGIGTDTPTHKVQVVGQVRASSFANANGTANAPSYRFNNDSNTGMYLSGSDALAFSTAGNEALKIDNIGNVGIGESNPSEKLHIGGNLNLEGAFLDKDGEVGLSGQVLSSTVTGTDWVSYANSPGNPFITNPYPKQVQVSETKTITIDGVNFSPTSVVTIPGLDGTIDSVNVLSPTEIEVTITTGTTEAVYDIVVANGSFLNTQWSAGNGENLLVVSIVTTLNPGDGNTGWVRVSSNVATSAQKLVPTTTASGWTKGASFGTVPANTDFQLDFNPVYMAGQSSGGYAMFGMDVSDPNYNYNTIDYAIYLQNGSNLYVYENGSNKGSHGTWNTSDTLSVRRTGTVIEYLKNGTVFYTSVTPNSSAMEFDSSLYRYLGAENISITY